MAVEAVYEEFISQEYTVVFNLDGNGDRQFSAIAHHLSSIGIFRSERTIWEEICRYLEQNPSDIDGTYGYQLTLQAASNLYQRKLKIPSSLGTDAMVHIFPKHSPPVAGFALGHFSECYGIHYVSVARKQKESENNEDGNEDEMTESKEGGRGTNERFDKRGVENSNGNRREYREDKEKGESVNEDQGQRGEDGRAEEVNWAEDDSNPFELLPDELLEMIIEHSLSGLSRGSFDCTTLSRSICKKYSSRGNFVLKASNWCRSIKRTPKNKKNLVVTFVTRTEALP